MDLVGDVVAQARHLPELADEIDRVVGIGEAAELPVEDDRRAVLMTHPTVEVDQVAGVARDEGLVATAAAIPIGIEAPAQLERGPVGAPAKPGPERLGPLDRESHARDRAASDLRDRGVRGQQDGSGCGDHVGKGRGVGHGGRDLRRSRIAARVDEREQARPAEGHRQRSLRQPDRIDDVDTGPRSGGIARPLERLVDRPRRQQAPVGHEPDPAAGADDEAPDRGPRRQDRPDPVPAFGARRVRPERLQRDRIRVYHRESLARAIDDEIDGPGLRRRSRERPERAIHDAQPRRRLESARPDEPLRAEGPDLRQGHALRGRPARGVERGGTPQRRPGDGLVRGAGAERLKDLSAARPVGAAPGRDDERPALDLDPRHLPRALAVAQRAPLRARVPGPEIEARLGPDP